MSKVTAILGSGRRGGNSEVATEALLSVFKADSDHHVITFPLVGMDIFHCRGCNECLQDGRCIIRDDMDIIYETIENTDILILSTPIYFSGPSSLMKQMIDRCQCLWQRNPRPEKRMLGFLVAVSGQPDANFQNTRSIAKSFFNTIGAEWAGELILPGYDAIGAVSNDRSAMEKSRKMGEALSLSKLP